MKNYGNSWSQWKKSVSSLSDESLLANTKECALAEREQAAWLVAHLAEVFRRDLALKRGYPSVFKYAREELALSDAMAWERISAARLALQIPETIERLARGELTLASAGALWKTIRDSERSASRGAKTEVAPAQSGFLLKSESLSSEPAALPLSSEQKGELFSKVLGKSRRESEGVLQAWKLEQSRASNGSCAGSSESSNIQAEHQPRPMAVRKPGPSSDWTALTFHLNGDELAEFDRLRDLLSQKLGTRDPQTVFIWLVNHGLEKVDPVRKQDRVDRRAKKGDAQPMPVTTPCNVDSQETPRRKSLSAELRRRVWIRDRGECQHVDPVSRRKCGATAFLDIDHRLPVAEGGEDCESNLTLACASHNRRRPKWGAQDQPVHHLGAR